jgi:predicted Zn-dependent protease
VGTAAALDAVVRRDVARAEVEARGAVAADPADPLARGALALALVAARRPKAALREADAAAVLSRGAVWARRLRSIVLREAGRTQEAILAAAEAASLAPDAPGAHVSHALALSLAGRDRAAEAALARARAVAPEDPEVLRLLADATVRRDPAAAEALCRECLRLAPTLTAARIGLGRALEAQGRAGEARSVLDAAALRDPAFAREEEARRRGVLGLVQAAAATFLFVVAAGLVQVLLTRRWPDRAEAVTAAAWLASTAVPAALLVWAALHLRRGRGEGPLDPDVDALARELSALAPPIAPDAVAP